MKLGRRENLVKVGEEKKNLFSWGGSYGASLSRVSLLSLEVWVNDSNGSIQRIYDLHLSQGTYLQEAFERNGTSLFAWLVLAVVH